MAPVEVRLRETVNEFAAYLESLPPALTSPQAWGPREVLAHISYWHERYVEIIESAAAGHEPSPLSASFRDLNARAVEAMAHESIRTMARRLIKAQGRLEAIAPEARRRRLRVAIKAGAKQWPVGELLVRVEGHIRGHQATLRRELRRAA